jgi:hypothetical protein
MSISQRIIRFQFMHIDQQWTAPVAWTLPLTSSREVGIMFPMPTLPFELTTVNMSVKEE